MRIKISVALLLAVPAIIVSTYFFSIKSFNSSINKQPVKTADDEEIKLRMRLKQKAAILSKYGSDNNFNTTHCFIMDLSIASGRKRFFIYNLKKDSVEQSGLVAHGSGSDSVSRLRFSNQPGSNCTSLGKYKIRRPYYGTFGLAYKLYGLDKTNSNAFNRFVVLHAHPCVPDNEVKPLEICRSWGCPTVSPTFLTRLKAYLDKSKQPILLWIFD